VVKFLTLQDTAHRDFSSFRNHTRPHDNRLYVYRLFGLRRKRRCSSAAGRGWNLDRNAADVLLSGNELQAGKCASVPTRHS
jgi:hypothetical protein